jgi:poly(A) polymerase
MAKQITNLMNKNMKELIKEKYDQAVSVVRKLRESGYEAYFVGGWVRDHLLGIENEDIDIATNCPVEVVPKLFPECSLVGMAFGIAIVKVGGEYKFEVATFRLEADYKDGRRPETVIHPTTAEKDAQRRDFTINALFYDPLKDEIIDFVGGQEDLKNKIVRAVGNPQERFEEDKLRMLRAVRYATKLDFIIEENTRKAIIQMAPTLSEIAVERIWQELEKIDKNGNLGKALVMFYELELLKEIFPRMKETYKFSSWKCLFTDIKGSPRGYAKELSKLASDLPTIAKFWAVFGTLNLKECKEFCDYYKIPNRDRKLVYLLADYRTYLAGTFALTDSEHFSDLSFFIPNARELELIDWIKFYADPNSQIVLEIMFRKIDKRRERSNQSGYLEFHEKRKKEYAKQIERIKNNDLVLKAEHLEVEGIESGKKMGLLLKEGERVAINQNLEDPYKVIKILKESELWEARGE